MEEVFKIWKDTRNPNGRGKSKGSLWEVSNIGRIRRNGVIVNGYTNGKGYVCITGSTRLHRVIAILFIDNPDNKPQVDHIDGNKQNNRVDNLRWVTQSENILNPNTNQALHKKRSKMCIEGRNKLSKQHIGCKWMTDGEYEYYVSQNDIEYRLQQGLTFGRLPRK